jgi:aryl-alcohol dehydrogenase-like predicted oxidoreductase
MDKHFLSRRQFSALCAAVGLSSVPIGAMALSGTSVLAADAPARTAKLRNSAIVPVIGQGSARLGQGRHPEAAEEEALRTGISRGMSLIDTSGDYGNGRSEKLIGRAIAGQRDRVFLVSKVEANEVSGDGMARACQASLSRLVAKVEKQQAARLKHAPHLTKHLQEVEDVVVEGLLLS